MKKNNVLVLLAIVLVVSLFGIFFFSNEPEVMDCSSDTQIDESIIQQSKYFAINENLDKKIGVFFRDGDLLIDAEGLTTSRASETYSMHPTVPGGAILILIPIEKDKLVVGDIVSINKDIDNNKILHRIVSITDEGYTTKGDNNENVDKEVWQFEQLDKKLVGILW